VNSRRQFIWMTAFALLVVVFATTNAQDACEALVNEALSAVDRNCEDLDRNSACYGYNRVDASFIRDVSEDFFSRPADRSEVAELEQIATAELDTDLNQWGVAVLSLQANIPETLPGQSVKFVLVGDVEVENAVDPAAAFEDADPLEVTTISSANVRSEPTTRANVIGGLRPGDVLLADGKSANGDWLRVTFNDGIGWVARAAIDDDPQYDDLPVIDGRQRRSMQSFFLRTGLGGNRCEQATDSVLIVQGPENLEIDLTVNGARIRIGSTILIRLLPPGDILEFIVIDGTLIIFDDITGEEVVVEEGFRTTVQVSPQNLGLDGLEDDLVVVSSPTDPEPLEEEDYNPWCSLQQFPGTVLNYNIPVPCEPQDDEDGTGDGGTPLGVINTPGSTPVIITTTQNEPDGCDSFALVDPLDGVPVTSYTYRWTSVAEATQYKLLFWNAISNTLAAEFRIPAPTTQFTTDLGPYPTGPFIQWEVIAAEGEEDLCSTGRSGIEQRIGDPNPPAPDDLTASWRCETTLDPELGFPIRTAYVSWANASGGGVDIEVDFGEGTDTYSAPGASGKISFPAFGFELGATVADDDEAVNLGPLECPAPPEEPPQDPPQDPPPPPPGGAFSATFECGETTVVGEDFGVLVDVSWENAAGPVSIYWESVEFFFSENLTDLPFPDGSTTIFFPGGFVDTFYLLDGSSSVDFGETFCD